MNWKIREVLSAQPKYELIENDLFDIAERIKNIDPSYFIVINKKNMRYEVHSTENIGATFCFLVPYDQLDVQTLQYCRETRVERDVTEYIDRINARAAKSEKRADEWERRDAATELAGHVRKYVENETLSPGYKRIHQIRRA